VRETVNENEHKEKARLQTRSGRS